jgi:hypothetical protein
MIGKTVLLTHRLGVSCFVASLVVAVPVRAADQARTAWDAQPGFHRVGFAEAAPPTLALSAGYGLTEPVGDDDGAHHRISSRLAGAIAPLSWLSVAASVDGRYDAHANDDDGTVLDAALTARAFTALSDAHVGLELRPWLPGAEQASTVFDALSLDSLLLFGVDLGTLRVATKAGYRLDGSEAAGESASRLSFGDRVALGLSDFDAVLVGAGAGMLLGKTEVFAEASGDILVGAGAPPVAESPLRATAGLRQQLSPHFSAEIALSASLSKRPDISPDSPLVPIEPRISALVGIRYRFTTGEPDAKAPVTPVVTPKAEQIPPPAAKPAYTKLELLVLDDEGQPVAGAKLSLRLAGTTRDVASDASGRHAEEHAALGPGEVSISAEGFEPLRRQFVLEAGVPLKLELKLTALPPPSQLRGVVRSFGGQGLAARVRVESLGIDVATDATGAFQIDVPPGDYEITIEADGYDAQKRRVRVDPKGVVILNADLTKSRRK